MNDEIYYRYNQNKSKIEEFGATGTILALFKGLLDCRSKSYP